MSARGIHTLNISAFVVAESTETLLGEALQTIGVAVRRDLAALALCRSMGHIQVHLTSASPGDEDLAGASRALVDGFIACIEVVQGDCLDYTRVCIDRYLPVVREHRDDFIDLVAQGLDTAMSLEQMRLQSNCGDPGCLVHGDLNRDVSDTPPHSPIAEG